MRGNFHPCLGHCERSLQCENLEQLVDEPSAKRRLSISPTEGNNLKKFRAAGRGSDGEDQIEEEEEGSEDEF